MSLQATMSRVETGTAGYDVANINGSLGSLVSRLATSSFDIRQAQELRYQVFCDELALGQRQISIPAGRDADRWDEICDHILIYDNARDSQSAKRPVATSRLLSSASAISQSSGFYSQDEFDVKGLMGRYPELDFLELGRTCVLQKWRNRRCMELLWHAMWAYAIEQNTDVLIGCASFLGTDYRQFSEPLSYLFHNHRTPERWNIPATTDTGFSMNLMKAADIDAKAAFHALPPLIKGYLRLGAWIGGEAVIDRKFGTVDIFVVLPIANLNPRHVAHYGKNAERYAGKPSAILPVPNSL